MNVRNVLTYLLGIGLGGLLLWLAFKDFELSALESSLREANFWWLIPGAFVGFLSHWLRAFRWQMLMKAAGHPVSTGNAFWSVMVGYLANNAVPRLGEITRCTMLSRVNSVPFLPTVGTVVVERAFDVLFLLFYLALVLLLEFDKLMGFFAEFSGQGKSQTGETSNLLLIVGACGVLLLGALFFFRKQLLATKLGQKAWEMAKTLIQSIISVRRLERVWLFVLVSFSIWICYAVFAYMLLLALPSTAHLGLYFAFFSTIIGSVGMAMPVPGGGGTYHYAIVLCFQAFGYAKSLGQVASLWLHTPQMVLTIVVGAVGYFVLTYRMMRTRRQVAAEA